MTEVVADRPDPERVRLLRSVFEPSPLDEVAQAVSVATQHEGRVYVERIGEKYRWSLTHPGGGYPLLRITARFLRVDYTKIMVPFRTVEDGICVVYPDPEATTRADRRAVIEFDGPTPVVEVHDRIEATLGSAG